ncbi:MAG TPA: ABC transporter permease, partial [Anaerolineales bacterium]|nr:ABC transporter permease [Anaerolineales bacterium]
MALYLSFKEVWRNKGRFFLFSLVIALITTLVLFIAALADGLALANKEYLEKLDAELLVFQENTDYSTTVSRIGRSKINDVARIPGVAEVGGIGFSNGTLALGAGLEDLDVSLIGVEALKPGAPPVLAGEPLLTDRGSEAIIDATVAKRAGAEVGDWIQIKTTQGTEEQTYELRVSGITDNRQYFFQPSIFLPYRTWDQIRPQGAMTGPGNEFAVNILAVKTENPEDWQRVAALIDSGVKGLETSDIKTAYESQPGYAAQQNTLNTQRIFVLLIGILVIGGFFQIQMLQKVPQIGVLKAVGASNLTVATTVVSQIILVTTFGVFFGALVSFGLAAGIPDVVPVV